MATPKFECESVCRREEHVAQDILKYREIPSEREGGMAKPRPGLRGDSLPI